MTRFSSFPFVGFLLAALLLSLPAQAAQYILYAGSYTAGTSKGIEAGVNVDLYIDNAKQMVSGKIGVGGSVRPEPRRGMNDQ